MKKLGLSLLMILCGVFGIINAIGTLAGVISLDLDMILFYGIFAALFIFANRKLAVKVKAIKVEGPKEKVKYDEEKPVKEKVSIHDRICNKLDKWSAKLDEKKKELDKQDPKDNAMIWKILDAIACVLLPILFIAAIIAVVVGVGTLVVWLIGVIFSVIGAILGFIFNAFLYVIGFVIAVCLIGGFLSFWWSLVKWEHVDKKRVYRRRKW